MVEKFITTLFVYMHLFHIVGGVGICNHSPSSRRFDNTTYFCSPGGVQSEGVLCWHNVDCGSRNVMHPTRLWVWSRHHNSICLGTSLPQLSSTTFYRLFLPVAFCHMYRLFLCIQLQIEAHLHSSLRASLSFLLLLEVQQWLTRCMHPHLCCYHDWHDVVVPWKST